MKARNLLVMRHAKSAWDTAVPRDFDRPLSTRGRRDCPRIAAWLAREGLYPDVILSSPAERAKETALRLLGAMASDEDVIFDDDLYLAAVPTLISALASAPDDAECVLLVGHNPGLDDLVEHLAAAPPSRSKTGKLMTTAALAWFRLPRDWSGLRHGCGELVELIRPREL